LIAGNVFQGKEWTFSLPFEGKANGEIVVGMVVGFNGTAAGTAFAPSGFIVDCPIVAFGS
jgi:hypothetical protein